MPRPRNTDERRAQIVGGMRRVLARAGYERASIADIARAAGLAQGLVHYHFQSKLEILEQLAGDLVATRAGLLEAKLEGVKDPWRRLEAVIDHHLHPGEDADPEALACWIVLCAEALREPRIRRAFALGVHQSTATFEQILRDGIKARAFRKVDVGATAAALAALIQGYYAIAAAAPNVIPRGSAHLEAKRMMRGLLRATPR